MAFIWGLALVGVSPLIITLVSELEIPNFAKSYTTRDVLVMALLIAIGGVFKAYWGQLRMIIESVFGPYASFAVNPGFMLWGVLANFLIRKPFSGTISMVLGGVVEILVGNPFGLPVLAFNFWEGLGPDIVFAATRYRKYNLSVSIIGGALAAALGLGYVWVYFGFAYLSIWAFLVAVVVELIGGAIGGVFGLLIATALERVGVKPPQEAVIETE